eukprot:TRINITY_DN599_c0_g1_i4.p1 TRINITY_DN599_c0_g1~~TRINITY_DN599_c0_g1_i4.p1  ORF type:complete len:456 (-),score=42.62 TRINITY_DN599_c0_g1_i4:582-1949(-)
MLPTLLFHFLRGEHGRFRRPMALVKNVRMLESFTVSFGDISALSDDILPSSRPLSTSLVKPHSSRSARCLDLPDELLGHVFSFLDCVSLLQASAVCKRFFQASMCDIDLLKRFCATSATPEALQLIEHRAAHTMMERTLVWRAAFYYFIRAACGLRIELWQSAVRQRAGTRQSMMHHFWKHTYIALITVLVNLCLMWFLSVGVGYFSGVLTLDYWVVRRWHYSLTLGAMASVAGFLPYLGESVITNAGVCISIVLGFAVVAFKYSSALGCVVTAGAMLIWPSTLHYMIRHHPAGDYTGFRIFIAQLLAASFSLLLCAAKFAQWVSYGWTLTFSPAFVAYFGPMLCFVGRKCLPPHFTEHLRRTIPISMMTIPVGLVHLSITVLRDRGVDPSIAVCALFALLYAENVMCEIFTVPWCVRHCATTLTQFRLVHQCQRRLDDIYLPLEFVQILPSKGV